MLRSDAAPRPPHIGRSLHIQLEKAKHHTTARVTLFQYKARWV